MFTARYRVYLIATLLLILPTATGRAEGLLYQLPRDGAWAQYDLDCTAKAGDVQKTVTGTMRISSVGRATVEEQPCRWIEVELNVGTVVDGKEVKNDRICKLLIPEKWLAAGQSPLDHVVRAWWQPESGAPVEKLRDPRATDTPLPVILSGPWQDVEPLAKAQIACPFGKLSCIGSAGTLKLPLHGGSAMNCKLESRLNPESPFGVVSSHWLLETPGGTLEWNLKLAKRGPKGESKLPDAK